MKWYRVQHVFPTELGATFHTRTQGKAAHPETVLEPRPAKEDQATLPPKILSQAGKGWAAATIVTVESRKEICCENSSISLTGNE